LNISFISRWKIGILKNFSINNKLVKILYSTLAIFQVNFHQPAHAQDVIDQARNHTVKITTAINYAFGLEKKTSMNGAGFLIDKSKGWILTNAHVAARSPSVVTVRFRDQDSIEAQKVYVDNHLDVAVIKVSPKLIPEQAISAQLNCEDNARPGTSVIAFGHPWDLDYTATRGIISGVRTVEGEEVLQTDSALNPGNSGGPLIDATTGQILGINSSHLEPPKSEGVSFAVPSPLVCRIINLLKDGQDPAPPLMPITFATTNKSNELVIASSEGNFRDILRPGDRILELDEDRDVISQSRFLGSLRGKSAARIVIARNSNMIEHSIQMPTSKDRVTLHGMSFSGMLVGPPTAKEAPEGLLIVHCVDPSSVAEQTQIQDGDQITAIGGKPMNSFDDIRAELIASNNKNIEIIIRRPNFNMLSGRNEYYEKRIQVTDLKEINENGVISKP
jgi:serine protease Do